MQDRQSMEGKKVMQDLEKLREEIDKIDDEILSQLSKRKSITKEIAKIKKSLGKPVFDGKRERQLIEKLKVMAKEKNLDKEFVQSVYNIILKSSKEEQEKIVKR